MRISVYGAGYVGLVSAVCLAKLGHHVICADINEDKIKLLASGECPIFEEQLPDLLNEQLKTGHLQFSSDISYAIGQTTIHVIATGTPGNPDGSADLTQVFAVASQIAHETNSNCLLITKSTVPVGTGDQLEALVQTILNNSKKSYRVDVVSNPEFLREGSAVHDFLNADRIIIGGEPETLKPLHLMYQPLVDNGISLLTMSRKSAELAKYTANAMLACKISFINQISRIAEEVGADIDEIRLGIGSDGRIGPHFLRAGIGYGGSCFPKDGRALAQTARTLGIETNLLDAIDAINDQQKNWVVEQLNKHFNHQLKNITVGIWGLAFKPDTDDMREASSLVIIKALIKAGSKLRLYDPVAMSAARNVLPEDKLITWCKSAGHVCEEGIDALVIATEWQQFKNYPLSLLVKNLAGAPLIDGRNCFSLTKAKDANLTYYSVGRPKILSTERKVHDAG